MDVGELVTVYSPNDSGEIEAFELIVESVDELEMYDGSLRRAINLNHTNPDYEFYQETWIEGIGHYYSGIDKSVSTFITDSGADLRCFLESDERVFPNGSFGSGLDCCTITSIDEMENTQINFYPSPASDLLNIASSFVISEIQVFDLLGQKIIQVLPRNTNHQMDVSSFSTGYYIIRIFDQNGTRFQQLLFVE